MSDFAMSVKVDVGVAGTSVGIGVGEAMLPTAPHASANAVANAVEAIFKNVDWRIMVAYFRDSGAMTTVSLVSD